MEFLVFSLLKVAGKELVIKVHSSSLMDLSKSDHFTHSIWPNPPVFRYQSLMFLALELLKLLMRGDLTMAIKQTWAATWYWPDFFKILMWDPMPWPHLPGDDKNTIKPWCGDGLRSKSWHQSLRFLKHQNLVSW